MTTSSLWSKTLLIVTFDEHGGTYDHVPPPWTAIPPDNVSENSGELGFKFNRFGVRVPTILISPFVRRGTVFRAEGEIPYDHTSIIKTVLRWQGITPDESLGLGRRMPKAPTFENVLSSELRGEQSKLPASTPDVALEEGLDAPLSGLHSEKLHQLAEALIGVEASEDQKAAIAVDVRKKCKTMRQLREYIEVNKAQGRSGLTWFERLRRFLGLRR